MKSRTIKYFKRKKDIRGFRAYIISHLFQEYSRMFWDEFTQMVLNGNGEEPKLKGVLTDKK